MLTRATGVLLRRDMAVGDCLTKDSGGSSFGAVLDFADANYLGSVSFSHMGE